MTDVPLPAPGSPNWFGWGAEQEELSDAAREIVSGRLTDAALRAAYVAVVVHGTDGSMARPDATSVLWIGDATPVNMTSNDIWNGPAA